MNKIKLLERPIRRDRRRRIEDNESRPVFWEVLQRDRAVAGGVAIKSREELGKGGRYSLFVVRAFIHRRSLLIIYVCHAVSRHWGDTKLTKELEPVELPQRASILVGRDWQSTIISIITSHIMLESDTRCGKEGSGAKSGGGECRWGEGSSGDVTSGKMNSQYPQRGSRTGRMGSDARGWAQAWWGLVELLFLLFLYFQLNYFQWLKIGFGSLVLCRITGWGCLLLKLIKVGPFPPAESFALNF